MKAKRDIDLLFCRKNAVNFNKNAVVSGGGIALLENECLPYFQKKF